MQELLSEHILTLLLASPFVGAVATALRRSRDGERAARRTAVIALCWSVLPAALALIAAGQFLQVDEGRPADTGLAGLTTQWSWVSDAGHDNARGYFDIDYHVAVDGLNLWLVVSTALLTTLAIAADLGVARKRAGEYYTLLLLLETLLLGAFLARDLMMFYICFELTMVPLFLLLGIWGGPTRQSTAFGCILLSMIGSALMLAGVLFLGYQVYLQEGVFTFDLDTLYTLELTRRQQWWLFVAMGMAFAVKVPLFPLNGWLSAAMAQAPVGVAIMLLGVVVKLGVFGILRFVLPILPWAVRSDDFAPLVAVLAILGALYATVRAWTQRDLVRIMVYFTVAHMAFCVLGLFSLKPEGITGAVLHMVNHGLWIAALLVLAEHIRRRFGALSLDAVAEHIGRATPPALFLYLFVLAGIGLPGLNGFVSLWMIVRGTLVSESIVHSPAGPLGLWYGLIAGVLVLLVAIYMLRIARRVWAGSRPSGGTPLEPAGPMRGLSLREISLLEPVAVFCVLLGLVPGLLTGTIRPSVRNQTLTHVFQLPADYEDPGQIGYEAIVSLPESSSGDSAAGPASPAAIGHSGGARLQ